MTTRELKKKLDAIKERERYGKKKGQIIRVQLPGYPPRLPMADIYKDRNLIRVIKEVTQSERKEAVEEFASYLLQRTEAHKSQPAPFVSAGQIHAYLKGIRVDFGRDPYEAIDQVAQEVTNGY